MRSRLFLYIASIFLSAGSWALAQEASRLPFKARVAKGGVDTHLIDEASGLAASGLSENVLWTHNDSGGLPHLFAIDTLGRTQGKLILVGVNNRDWEDIAAGPGPVPGKRYLYIADIGDNDHRYHTKTILRLEEPALSRFENGKLFLRSSAIDRLNFTYPDGMHNAETLLCHPNTAALYIVTKAKKGGRVYRLKNEESAVHQQAEFITVLPIAKATGGGISPNGHEILVKNYFFVYYWCSKKGAIEQLFTQAPRLIPYVPESQGEAICFDKNNRGFFTLSESRKQSPVQLYYYPRTDLH